jgi:lipopolysaccharide transport system ATP-binding protein
VLAVGDTEFQKKCLGKMKEVSVQGGRTVLFVSHNMAAVNELCSKGIYLQQGTVHTIASARDALSAYLAYKGCSRGHFVRPDDLPRTTGWWIEEAFLSQGERQVESIDQKSPLQLTMRLKGVEARKLSVEYILRDETGSCVGFCPLGLGHGQEHMLQPGEYSYVHRLDLPHLASGSYSLDLILADTGVGFLDNVERGVGFEVESTYNPKNAWSFKQQKGQGSILLPAGEGRMVPSI